MFAEIIAIGSELTSGSKLDTNSQWLSRELEAEGWTVVRHTTLADDMEAMVAEFRAAAARAQVVLITGGLGPTLDDITRDALALAFKQRLVRDADSLVSIRALFAARGREMPERNERQADRPEHAVALHNACGTAPGILMRVESDGSAIRITEVSAKNSTECLIAVMPGVPAEMKPMFTQQIRPHLLNSGLVLRRTVIRSFGYGESDAERLLGDLTARGRNPEVGITASEAVISLWVTARSESTEIAEQRCSETTALVRERLGDAVYAQGDAELHDVVAEMLSERKLSIAIVEGGTTGGQIAMWMSESPETAKVVSAAMIIPDRWDSAAYSAWNFEHISLPNGDAENWLPSVAAINKEIQLNRKADFVLFSSRFYDESLDSGVVMRRGLVAVGTAETIQKFDVSMSGNLAIFRQRAARTALNQLRLILKSESTFRNSTL